MKKSHAKLLKEGTPNEKVMAFLLAEINILMDIVVAYTMDETIECDEQCEKWGKCADKIRSVLKEFVIGSAGKDMKFTNRDKAAMAAVTSNFLRKYDID